MKTKSKPSSKIPQRIDSCIEFRFSFEHKFWVDSDGKVTEVIWLRKEENWDIFDSTLEKLNAKLASGTPVHVTHYTNGVS